MPDYARDGTDELGSDYQCYMSTDVKSTPTAKGQDAGGYGAEGARTLADRGKSTPSQGAQKSGPAGVQSFDGEAV